MSYLPFSRIIRRRAAFHRLNATGPTKGVIAQAGFSLIELLVVCAILAVISGLILVNNSRFGGVIRLESLAYDVALSLRQAQVYGISVARNAAGLYASGFGVQFDLASPNSFILFGDSAGTANGLYDSGELVKTTLIQGGYTITQLCVTPSGQAEDCTPTKLNVLFLRPEPDAWISANAVSCILSASYVSCYSSARIRIRSPRGDLMSIIVDVNGQIAVQNS